MRDVLNLAWKFKLIKQGKAHEAILDSYQAERDGNPPPTPMDRSSGYGQGCSVPPLRDGITTEGERPRLDTLLGTGFAVVYQGKTPPLDVRASQMLEITNGRLVAADELEVVQGQWDRFLGEHDAVLVRPDRYVFGFTTEQISVNDLLHDAANQMSLITPK